MSIESMMVAHHLNQIEAGRTPKLELQLGTYDWQTAEFASRKRAIQLICMGKGLIKVCELAIRTHQSP